jgi:hypothetical protein
MTIRNTAKMDTADMLGLPRRRHGRRSVRADPRAGGARPARGRQLDAHPHRHAQPPRGVRGARVRSRRDQGRRPDVARGHPARRLVARGLRACDVVVHHRRARVPPLLDLLQGRVLRPLRAHRHPARPDTRAQDDSYDAFDKWCPYSEGWKTDTHKDGDNLVRRARLCEVDDRGSKVYDHDAGDWKFAGAIRERVIAPDGSVVEERSA